MLRALSLAIGLVIWVGAMWDGFATIVLPRTVAPMRRLSGRFYHASWWVWSKAGLSIKSPGLRLAFLAVYGPISVVILLVIWGTLAVLGFAFIYLGLGAHFDSTAGAVDFGSLICLSGSTFLTLGLGEVTSADGVSRTFMILEAATGYVFLGLIITYMPLLDQAYSAREINNMLIHSRAGAPPSAIRLLRRYVNPDHSEILRGHLREGERWLADILQSHLAHPVLCFYRAQHYGRSWLAAIATILDTCSLLIVGGEGIPMEQARLTYRMGLLLLADLTKALAIEVPRSVDVRLSEADVPALRAALENAGIRLRFGPQEATHLLKLSRRYDFYLRALARRLMIALPPWVPPIETTAAAEAAFDSEVDEEPFI
jgi:hypothetical protein